MQKRKVFSKGDETTYSKEVYVISAKKGNRFELKDENGVRGLFKPYEIKKVNEIEMKKPEVEHETEHEELVKEKKVGKKHKQSGLDVVSNKIVIPPTVAPSRAKRDVRHTTKFYHLVHQLLRPNNFFPVPITRPLYRMSTDEFLNVCPC